MSLGVPLTEGSLIYALLPLFELACFPRYVPFLGFCLAAGVLRRGC